MKKQIKNYIITFAIIYLSYFLFSLIFATLYHFFNIHPSFYNIATLICSYTVVFVSSIVFYHLQNERILLHGLLFVLLFTMINMLFLRQNIELLPLLYKNLIFIGGLFFMRLIKK